MQTIIWIINNVIVKYTFYFINGIVFQLIVIVKNKLSV